MTTPPPRERRGLVAASFEGQARGQGHADHGAVVRQMPFASPLMQALGADDPGELQLVLDDDPCLAISEIRGLGEPPVVAAVRMACDPAMLEVLLQAGADPNARDRTGLDALTLVASVRRKAWPRIAPPCCALAGQSPLPSPQLELDHRSPQSVWPLGGTSGSSWGSFDSQTMLQAAIAGIDKLGPFVSMVGVRKLFPEAELDERRCCEYAALLLLHGAAFGHRGHLQRARAVSDADAAGRFRLARLLADWGGDEVRAFSIASARTPGLRRRRSPPIDAPSQVAVLTMPDALFRRICSMLAPPLPEAMASLFGT